MNDKASTNPPMAKQTPYMAQWHEKTLHDEYHWLRDPSYPHVKDTKILNYLRAENDYYARHMKEQEPLKETIFQEMKGRVKESDKTVPQKDGHYVYWSSFDAGDQYRRHWRRAINGKKDELLIDENALAKGKQYFRLGSVSISPDGRLMAYAIDDNGSERFTAYVQNLETGALLPDRIEGTLSSLIWSGDNAGFVYCLANEQWRTDNAHYHRLGDNPANDTKIFHEEDEGFRVSVGLSADENYIFLSTNDHVTSEIWFVPASNPLAPPRLIQARKKGVEYNADIGGEALFILSNQDHVNFTLYRAGLEHPDIWDPILTGDERLYLTGVDLFKNFFIVSARDNGLDRLSIHQYDEPQQAKIIAFDENSYSVELADNPEYDVEKIRLAYSSMVTPASIMDYHLLDGRLETLKTQEIPSGYDKSQYRTQRLMISARDGVPIPVSIVHHVDFPMDGTGALHLYGYGAYGISIDPSFSTTRISLLDRGFAFAIAHIRGGDDMGYPWYQAGKLDQRMNTFHDFIDVAKGLISRQYARAGRISISGGSAGGELMGVAINLAPELFGAVVAHVPFVDVLNTMLDASLPLTPGEWPEWGNPIEDADAFSLIQSYSPYDNVEEKAYPPMLVTGGLNDPRVTYWEPAKWVARLRSRKTDDRLLLLKTNMGAGHGGKSGRWEGLYEIAEEYAFILWQMGLVD